MSHSCLCSSQYSYADHESIKKPSCWVESCPDAVWRNSLSRHQLSLVRLFHGLVPYPRRKEVGSCVGLTVSFVQLTECPRVSLQLLVATWTKTVTCTDESPCIILWTSIKSVMFRRSSRDHSPRTSDLWLHISVSSNLGKVWWNDAWSIVSLLFMKIM